MAGTPIVARMPYDNKQCKAYKALKIKYAAIAEDENIDTGINIFSWENDAPVTTEASALIPLNTVSKYLKPTGYTNVIDTLQNQHVEMVIYPSSVLDYQASRLYHVRNASK